MADNHHVAQLAVLIERVVLASRFHQAPSQHGGTRQKRLPGRILEYPQLKPIDQSRTGAKFIDHFDPRVRIGQQAVHKDDRDFATLVRLDRIKLRFDTIGLWVDEVVEVGAWFVTKRICQWCRNVFSKRNALTVDVDAIHSQRVVKFQSKSGVIRVRDLGMVV